MDRQRRSLSWHLGSSALWFGQSFKWFILLLLTLSDQVAKIAGDDSKNAALGQVFALGATWAAIGPFIMGWLSYRIPAKMGRHRFFLLVGGFFTVVALIAMRNATTIPMLMASYLLLQISDDASTGPYSGLIPERVSEEDRGRASGILAALRFGAQIAGGIFGAVLSDDLSGIYYGIAIVTVICTLISVRTLKGEPAFVPSDESKVSFKGLAADFLAPWKSADFVRVFAVTWIGNFGYYMIQTYLRNYFDDEIADFRVMNTVIDLKAFTVEDANHAIMFLGLLISFVGIFGAILATKLTDRIGRKKTVFIGGALMSLPLVPFALIHDFTVVVSMAPFFAIGMGLYQSASWALVSDILPNEKAIGTDMGIWQAAFSSVQIGSGLLGFVIDGLNKQQPGMGYTGMFLIGATLMFGGALLAQRVRGSH